MQCPSVATAERRSPCHYLASGSDRARALPGPVVALQRLLRPSGGTPSQTRPLAVSDGQQGLQPRTLLLRPGDRSGMESRICRFRAGFAMLTQPLKRQRPLCGRLARAFRPMPSCSLQTFRGGRNAKTAPGDYVDCRLIPKRRSRLWALGAGRAAIPHMRYFFFMPRPSRVSQPHHKCRAGIHA